MKTLGLALTCTVLNVLWLPAFSTPQLSNPPRFEAASIKPNDRNDGQISMNSQGGRYTATGVSAAILIRSAYQVQEFQIVGGPAWLNTSRFDVVAKQEELNAADPLAATVSGPLRQQLMLRGLLEDRFSLSVHRETRDMPVYALVMARNDRRLGPQLKRSTVECADNAPGRNSAPAASRGRGNPTCGTSVGPGVVVAWDRTMAQVATALSTLTNTGSSLNRLIIDRTGLEGAFSLELRFTPDQIPNFGPSGPPRGMPAIDPNGPSIFTAVQEQLGLTLDAQRGPVEVLVVDRIERPTPD